MAEPLNKFSFQTASFQKVVAHDGIGTIRTSRVADNDAYRGLNFIDLTEIPVGSSIGTHTHGLLDEEIYIVVSGQGKMLLGDDESLVAPGDVIVNPTGGTHGLCNTGTEPLRIVVLDVPVKE